MNDTATNDPVAAIADAAKRSRLEEEAAKAMSRARGRMVVGNDLRIVFFAVQAMELRLVPDWTFDTACTDGQHLYYNPEFIAGLSKDECIGLLAHEVMHCAHGHMSRRGVRPMRRWNIAADLAINFILRQSGIALPAGGLLPGEGRYSDFPPGLSAEQYDALLRERGDDDETGDAGGDAAGGAADGDTDMDAFDRAYGDGDSDGKGKGKSASGNDPGGCGGVMDAGDPAAQRKSESDWKQRVIKAAEAVKGRGELPADIKAMVEAASQPEVRWYDVLRPLVTEIAKEDYSWVPPNRRYIHADMIMPSLRSLALGRIVVAVDTSGSISDQVLSQFGAELQAIVEPFDCELLVLYHDSRVTGEYEWQPSDGPLEFEPVGRGGTNHRPVFDRIDADDVPPKCVICLTDGYTDYPDSPPGYPVLWVMTTDCVAPFGETIRMEAE